MKIVSAVFLLFLVMDPVGNVPVFLSLGRLGLCSIQVGQSRERNTRSA